MVCAVRAVSAKLVLTYTYSGGDASPAYTVRIVIYHLPSLVNTSRHQGDRQGTGYGAVPLRNAACPVAAAIRLKQRAVKVSAQLQSEFQRCHIHPQHEQSKKQKGGSRGSASNKNNAGAVTPPHPTQSTLLSNRATMA